MYRNFFKPSIAVLALLVTFTAGVGLSYASPVLFSTYHFRAISAPPIALFNPLRDRIPERHGDTVLSQMRSGEYKQVLESLVEDVERRKHVYMREAEYPIESWVLGDRQDDAEGVTLLYWAKRRNYDYRLGARISIRVDKNNGEWRATSYSPIY